MPADRHCHETCACNAVSHFRTQHRRRQLVAIANQHERRATNIFERRPRILAAHDGGLLADESLGAGFFRHESDDAPELLIVTVCRMNGPRERGFRESANPAFQSEVDLGSSILRLLRRVRPRGRIEQGHSRGEQARPGMQTMGRDWDMVSS